MFVKTFPIPASPLMAGCLPLQGEMVRPGNAIIDVYVPPSLTSIPETALGRSRTTPSEKACPREKVSDIICGILRDMIKLTEGESRLFTKSARGPSKPLLKIRQRLKGIQKDTMELILNPLGQRGAKSWTIASFAMDFGRCANDKDLQDVISTKRFSKTMRCLFHVGLLEQGKYSRDLLFQELARIKGDIPKKIFKTALVRALTASHKIPRSVLVPAEHLPSADEDASVISETAARDIVVDMSKIPAGLREDIYSIFRLPGHSLKGWYMIPMKTGLHGETYGRSFFAGEGPSYVFKGVGYDQVIGDGNGTLGILFGYKKRFDGGLVRGEDDPAQTRALRKSFKKLLRQAGEIASMFQVKNDVFFTPEVVFRPWMIPVAVGAVIDTVSIDNNAPVFRMNGQRIVGIVNLSPLRMGLANRTRILRHFGLDQIEKTVAGEKKKIGKDQAVMLYKASCDHRLEQLNDAKKRAPFFQYYGFELVEEDGKFAVRTGGRETTGAASALVCFGAAIRMRLGMEAIHSFGLVARYKDVGSVFSDHNVNPLSLFDYDTVSEPTGPNDRKIDERDAEVALVRLCKKFKLSSVQIRSCRHLFRHLISGSGHSALWLSPRGLDRYRRHLRPLYR